MEFMDTFNNVIYFNLLFTGKAVADKVITIYFLLILCYCNIL